MQRSVVGLCVGLLLGLAGAAHANQVSIDFTGDQVVASGLTQVNNDRGSDGFTTIVKQGGLNTAATGGTFDDQFLYLKMDDSFKQNLTSAWAAVTFFDRGTNGFKFEYDGTVALTNVSGPTTKYQYDTQKFQTQVWHLVQFHFQGELEGGADVRIRDLGQGPVYIAKVVISDTDPNTATLGHFPYATKAPVIDGQVSPGEWDKALKVTVNNPGQDGFQKSNMPTLSPEYSATFSFMYDETNLYLLEQVVDATPLLNSQSDPTMYYAGDGFQLFIGMDDSEPERTSFASTDFDFIFKAGGTTPGAFDWTHQASGGGTNGSLLPPIGNNAVVTKTSDGYLVEMRIPWTALVSGSTAGQTIKQGQKFSYYFFANNSTVLPSDQQVALGPIGATGASTNPSRWIKSVLDPKP